MSPAQRKIVEELQREGFQIVENCTDIVRLTNGADKRLVRADGSVMRANHIEWGGK